MLRPSWLEDYTSTHILECFSTTFVSGKSNITQNFNLYDLSIEHLRVGSCLQISLSMSLGSCTVSRGQCSRGDQVLSLLLFRGQMLFSPEKVPL